MPLHIVPILVVSQTPPGLNFTDGEVSFWRSGRVDEVHGAVV
jgi:hypothetical protein